MSDKEMIEREYERWLKLTNRLVGTGVTSASLLKDIGTKLFGRSFLGVFPSDQIPRVNKGECAIANVDKSGDPGSHWVALTKNHIYDSYGRDHDTLMPDANIDQEDTERDAEQDIRQNNCGSRCMAFLICHQLHGDKVKYI
jgi:hypothetical protein